MIVVEVQNVFVGESPNFFCEQNRDGNCPMCWVVEDILGRKEETYGFRWMKMTTI